MVHEGIFATSDEILVKAGENVDLTGATEPRINDLASQSESIINWASRYNWSDGYAGLNVDVKRILSAASSAWCGIMLISFNLRGEGSSAQTRTESESQVNILRDDFLRNLSIIREIKSQTFALKA